MSKYTVGILPCAHAAMTVARVRDLEGVHVTSHLETSMEEYMELSLEDQMKHLVDLRTELILEQDEIQAQYDLQFPIMEKFHKLTLTEQLELAKSMEPIEPPADHDHELHEQFATSFAQAGIGKPHHAPMNFHGQKKVFIELAQALGEFEAMYGPTFQIAPENITWDWLRAGAPALPQYEGDIKGVAFQVQAREALRTGRDPCPDCPLIDATIPITWYTPIQNFWEEEVPHVGILLTTVCFIAIAVGLYASEALRQKLALIVQVIYLQFRDRADHVKRNVMPATPKWWSKKVAPQFATVRTRIRNMMPVPLSPGVRKVVNVLFGQRTRDQNGRLYRANPKAKPGSQMRRIGQSEHGSPSIRSRSISAFSSSADRSPPRIGNPPPALD